MDRLLPSPSLNPDDALTRDLQKLSIATASIPGGGGPSSTSASTSPSTSAGALPSLIHRTSNLSGSLPNSPLRRKSSTSTLPGSPSASARPMSRSPSMMSLSKEAMLQAAAPPLPPLTHPDTETLVILSDSSYLHKFARSTTKQDLETIVERPERLRAATFGISAAVCKLEANNLSVIKTDRKGSLEDPSVTRVHDADYLRTLLGACDESEKKLASKTNELPPGWHTGDLYLCGGSREDFEGCVGAVWEGVDRVFGDHKVKSEPSDTKDDASKFPKVNRAFVSIRPPGHHCADGEPSGFCYLNNVHIAIARAALQYDMTHAVIFDFDLHHGDGSQTIAWEVNNRHSRRAPKNTPHIAYYSLHDINSYPCEMGDFEKVRNASTCLEDAHNQNIWNVHLETYKDSQDFWQLYEEKYSVILQKAEAFLVNAKANYRPGPKHPRFKAGIFISAGFDASEHEQETMQRHKVNVLTEFYARFTSDSVELANKYAGGRVLSVLEGGYSDKAIWTGVFSHLCGLALPRVTAPVKREEVEVVVPEIKTEKVVARRSSLAQDLTGKTFKSFASEPGRAHTPCTQSGEYDPAWFTHAKLDEVDKAMHVVPSVPSTRKPRDTSNSSYYSPTASSAAKAAAAPKLHRKSSTNLAESASQAALNRTPSPPPPPPPLEWPAASAAVWRSLLPENQLAALREAALPPPPPTELTVEKPRRVGKRHSAVGIPAVDIVTAASSRPIRNIKKVIPDIPERSGSALSSVAESQISRRTSMVSIKSSDTADTAITAISQTSGRRKVSPPQKPVATKATATKTTKPVATSTSTRQSIGAKKTGTQTASTTVLPRAPTRTSSVRQSVPGRKASPTLKTNGVSTTKIKTEEQSVSPIEPPSVVPSIRTTSEPDDGQLDAITSGLQSIKLTYKNRERDEAEEIQKQLNEKEKAMASIQAQKKQLLEKKQKELQVDGPSSNGGVIIPDFLAPIVNEGKPTAKPLPRFTANSAIPFGEPSKLGPLPPSGTTFGTGGAKPALTPAQMSFRDRITAMTPFKPKEKGPWEVGDEITPVRAYKPTATRVIPPHSPEMPPRQPSPRLVDADLKKP
ncbi:hypothetical protein H072_8923 [Dactylellina haptotyla CBS 200.50]|uniref:Histone deacetylase domain-containing protein n=1 Tax=Dactylellina haptotyla (strain CBS 200.50) TaxID=1284197 RepID=S8A8I4_DACHA|nr:hypothetical protein H072_8923 [Dactylellina haptotyla CBS 200.50]